MVVAKVSMTSNLLIEQCKECWENLVGRKLGSDETICPRIIGRRTRHPHNALSIPTNIAYKLEVRLGSSRWSYVQLWRVLAPDRHVRSSLNLWMYGRGI